MQANEKLPPVDALAEFGEAFHAVRVASGYSHARVAKVVGKNQGAVKKWETGEGRPIGRDIPRLAALMPRIKPYLRLLCNLPQTKEDAAALAKVTADAEPMPEAIEEAPPATFGEALRRARLRVGFGQAELTQLLAVGQQAMVSKWELGIAAPMQAKYEKLIDLFPELVAAPVPKGCKLPSEPEPEAAPPPPVEPPPPVAPDLTSWQGTGAVEVRLRPVIALHADDEDKHDHAMAVRAGRAIVRVQRARAELAAARADLREVMAMMREHWKVKP